MHYIIAIAIFLLILSVQSISLPKQCSGQLLQNQDCSWYLQCLQAKYQCGSKGYPEGYGYKYCSKFSKIKSKANPIVKKWIQATTICLKKGLQHFIDDQYDVSNYKKQTKVCNKLKEQAFESHPICYTQSGFCELWGELGLAKSSKFVEELLSIFELKDFASYLAIKQIAVTLEICAKKDI